MRPTSHALESILPFIYLLLNTGANSKKKQHSISIVLVLFLCSFISYAQTNLLDTSTWTVGQGSVGSFNAYQDDISETERVTGIDPHGNTSVLWKGIPSGNGNKDGGWTQANLSIDHTKTYRFTVWFKKTSSHDGTEIFGFRAYDSASQKVSLNLDGTTDNFPWFSTDDLPQLGIWYLMVGFVHASNYNSTTHSGAMYATDGTLVRSLIDYKFSTTAMTMGERNILWNDDLGASEIYYWNPTIYEINGQEPTVQELVNGPNVADTQAPTAPSLSNTAQTDTTSDLNWTGATDNTAVTGYKIFKNGVLEATLGNVSAYTVTGLTASTTYTFTVTALDTASNESTVSNSVSVTTSGSGGSSGNWVQSGSGLQYTTGNVGIGTTAQASYKLAVEGKIHTKEVKVDLNGWADYVFTKEYHLPTLEEVENHIKTKGHLINIPSAEEVEANGIELGEMNRLLLEKIEELTLYILDQETKYKDQGKTVKTLENRITNLEQNEKK